MVEIIGENDKFNERLEETFGVHFAALDAALGSVANIIHIMALTQSAARLKAAGSDSPVLEAIQLRDEVVAMNSGAKEGEPS